MLTAVYITGPGARGREGDRRGDSIIALPRINISKISSTCGNREPEYCVLSKKTHNQL